MLTLHQNNLPERALQGGNVDEPAVGVRHLRFVRDSCARCVHVRVRLLKRPEIQGNDYKSVRLPLSRTAINPELIAGSVKISTNH